MADDDKRRLATLHKLMALLVEVRAKETALLEEIDSVLGGAPGIGMQIKALYAAWTAVWRERYKVDYYIVPTRDTPHAKRLLKAFPLADLEARMVVYIRSDDPFYLKNRHPFALFAATINSHVEPSRRHALEDPDDAPPAWKCPHAEPWCQNPSQCYIRSEREARH